MNNKWSGYMDILYPDSSGCLGSCPLEDPITIDLPPESYWWKTERKRFKVYKQEAVFQLGKKAREGLKRIPEGSKRVTIIPRHRSYLSCYEYKWE